MLCLLVSFPTDTVSWLVGVQIKVVIATSDLWLFIHASNLLPSFLTPFLYRQNETVIERGCKINIITHINKYDK